MNSIIFCVILCVFFGKIKSETSNFTDVHILKAGLIQHFPVEKSSCLLLKLKTTLNAYHFEIIFRKEQNKDPYLKYILTNAKLTARDNLKILADNDVTGLLSNIEFRGLWITWNENGFMKLGQEYDDEAIFVFKRGPHENIFNYLSIISHSHDGALRYNFDNYTCPGPTNKQGSHKSIVLQKYLLQKLQNERKIYNNQTIKYTKYQLDMDSERVKKNLEFAEKLHNNILLDGIRIDTACEEYLNNDIFKEILDTGYEFVGEIEKHYTKLGDSY